MSERERQRPSEREAIEATAAAWLAQRDAGLSPEETVDFARWRALDPRHEAAVARLEATWSALQQLRDFRPEAARHPDRDLLRRGVLPRRAKAGALALAIAAAIALMAVGWFAFSHRATVAPHYATSAEGYERVTLEDGSLLELNASTEVRLRYAAHERLVHLLRGEAHFTVARDPARPFRVVAGTVSVAAVGTAFNVRLGEKDIEVIVTEGKVRVGESAPEDSSRPSVAAPPPPTLLGANERALIPLAPETASPEANARVEVARVSPEEIRASLAWQGPRLIFADTPLAEAVAQFNQRNTVELVIADPAIAALPIGGSFRPENIEGFVRLLVSSGAIQVERPTPERIVLRGTK